ncbi:MAG: HAD-IA family hydrolase [Euryarchaeota archaeon]|nr:HAD-IA family hydrolase [Euryarchaeota archaeon]MDE1880815.1 HAD-IA family hydrolase [Euryarchaeota archaeon]
MRVSTIFFDFGGTLARLGIDPHEVWTTVCDDFSLGVTQEAILAANQEADRRFAGELFSYHGRTREFWRLRDMWVLEHLGVQDRREEVFEALQRVFEDPTQVHPYPESVRVLEALRSAGYRLGVISNFTDHLLPLLEFHGLRPFFGSVTYSQEVGVEKPDEQIFRRALERSGSPPEEAVHVGDSWEADVEGARRSGLSPVWLDRSGGEEPRDCATLHDLSGLRGVLERLEGRAPRPS